MTNSSTPIPALSDGTTAAITNLIEYTIEREYGQDVDVALRGARTLALAGLQFDLRDQFVNINGHDNGLVGYAESTLRILVRDGLAARVCQCSKLNPAGCRHGRRYTCSDHYEADVPPINGALLCGTCYIGEYQTRD